MCVHKGRLTAPKEWSPDPFYVGHFEVWICAQCGFTEWYAMNANQGFARLAAVPNSGVHWIDTTPQRGPCR
jgi:hypothetical protein